MPDSLAAPRVLPVTFKGRNGLNSAESARHPRRCRRSAEKKCSSESPRGRKIDDFAGDARENLPKLSPLPELGSIDRLIRVEGAQGLTAPYSLR